MIGVRIIREKDLAPKLFELLHGQYSLARTKIYRSRLARFLHDPEILLGNMNLPLLETMLGNGDCEEEFKKFRNMEELYEDRIGALITHETLHIILRIKVSGFASEGLDEIDEGSAISDPIFMIGGKEDVWTNPQYH